MHPAEPGAPVKVRRILCSDAGTAVGEKETVIRLKTLGGVSL